MNLIGTGYIDITKIRTGEEAESAKYVILNGQQIFKFNDSSFLSTPYPETIEITAQTFNINVFKAEWQYYKNSREGWITIESETSIRPFVVDPFSDLWQNAPTLTIRLLVNDVYFDEITIAKIADGTDSITVILTNETQTIPANSMGELLIPDLEKVKTYIQVFEGNTQLINTETKRYFTTEIKEQTGMTAKVTEYGNSITAVSLVEDYGEVEITVRLVGEVLGGILKKFTLVKAKYGEDGKDGTPSPAIDIYGNQIIKQTGDSYKPSEIKLTALKQNFLLPENGGWYYLDETNTWIKISEGVSEGDSFSILVAPSSSFEQEVTNIRYMINESLYDQVSIAKLTDGTGYTVILSNESMSVSSSADGIVSSLDKLSTFVHAYNNTKSLMLVKDNPIAGQYSISVPYFDGGGAIVDEQGMVQVISFDKNVDLIQVPINVSLEGENVITKYMTISKSKSGEADSQNNLLKEGHIINVDLDGFSKEKYPFTGLVVGSKPSSIYPHIELVNLGLLADTYYTLHFSIKKTDGSLVNIGGWTTPGYSNQVSYTVDNKEYANFTKPSSLNELNDGNLHYVTYTFKTSSSFIRNEYIALYINKDLTTPVQFEIHKLKLERGLGGSEWVPNLPDIGDVVGELVDTITIIEQKTTDNAIISTVTESTYFKDYMNSKADLDALKDYATNENLNDAEDQWKGNLEAFYKDYLESTEKFESELEQTSKEITAKFSASGGVNLIKNSVGFAGTQHWNMAPSTSISHIQNDELKNLGYGSGWYSSVGMNSSRAISQDFPLLTGNDFTLTVYINKRTDAGTAVVYLDNEEIGAKSTKTSGYEKFQYVLKKPTKTKATVTISVSQNAEAIITGLIVHLGDIPLQWTMAPGEIYNTNVQMDLNGIKVSNIQLGKERNYTVMTPTKFAGYYDMNFDGTIDEAENSVDEVFRIDKDEFVMKKAVVRDEMTMGTIKMIQINSDKTKGWAYVPTL